MKIKCPGCANVLSIPDSAAGKVVKCPCGKQLRAPGGPAAAPQAGQPRAAAPQQRPTAAARPVPQRPAARPAAGGGFGGSDAEMFNELTDGDLKPVTAVARPGMPKPSNPYQSPVGGMYSQEMSAAGGGSRKPLASRGARFGGKVLDNFIHMAGIGVGFGVILGIEAMSGPDREPSAALAVVGLAGMVGFSMLPVIINAYLIATCGQSMGKKVVGTRIIKESSGGPPGFVIGVLWRSWSFAILGQIIPFFALIDAVSIFSDGNKCLHDQWSGTIVVEA